ncbi:MAG: glucosamine-6-phosphate deaminase [Planctomycetota bacterium]
MRIVVCESPDQVAMVAADESIEYLGLACSSSSQSQETSVLGLATGSTPLGLYQQWIKRHRAGEISFRNVVSFNLDEYYGVPPEDPQSYHYFMQENLFKHIDILPLNTHIPKTDCQDLPASAEAYEIAIAQAGGIDLQILGIGTEGHIGFNELGSSLSSATRVKTLTSKTRQDNARFFASMDQVPKMAITMGLGTIMNARAILLLATGVHKAATIRDTVEGPVTAMVPASILQFHPNATVVIDQAAASKLAHLDYYLECERNQQSL